MSRQTHRTKESVILGMGVFTERVLVTRRCVQALVSVIREISVSKFSELEMDTVISRILHVFQSKDAYLKALCFAFIRATAHLSSGSFIAINALSNAVSSMKSGEKREALKLLIQITPSAMLDDCAKHVQQCFIEAEYATIDAIVPVLLFSDERTVSEWFGSSNWLATSGTSGPFGNALLLLSRTRSQDTRSLVKTVCSAYLRGYSAVLGIRYLSDHFDLPSAKKKIQSALRFEEGDDASFIEAVRLLAAAPDGGALSVDLAVKGLRQMLGSASEVVLVAALRTIDILASSSYRSRLSPLRSDVEDMLGRGGSPALLAMGVLLRIGTQKMAEKISKQLPKVMAEMGDAQKLSIIAAVGGLCEKFGGCTWTSALRSALQGRSTCEHKVKMVQGIAKILRNSKNPELRRSLEDMLCDYIEDSPYPRVTVEILGVMIGNSSQKYITCLLNRVILDTDSAAQAVELSLAVARGNTPLGKVGAPNAPGVGVTGSNPILTSTGSIFTSTTTNPIFASAFKTSNPNPTHKLPLTTTHTLSEEIRNRLGKEICAFFEPPRKQTVLESVYGEKELRASRKIPLNRSGSEFALTVTKHTFNSMLVLRYSITSQIDFVLEQGVLDVFLGNNKILSEKIHLRGKEGTEIRAEVKYSDPSEVIGQTVSTSFSYTVNDNRDYETGEIKIEPYDITLCDFIIPGQSEETEILPEGNSETKTYPLGMSAQMALSELKKIFDLSPVSEDTNEFRSIGTLITTGTSISITVSTKEGTKGRCTASISISTPDDTLKDQLFNMIE